MPPETFGRAQTNRVTCPSSGHKEAIGSMKLESLLLADRFARLRAPM
jgi:hypothetical protein